MHKFTLEDNIKLVPGTDGVRRYPGDTDYSELQTFPENSEFGLNCRFGSSTSFGAGTKFKSWSIFGDYCDFGANTEFGAHCIFQRGHRFGPGVAFGSYQVFTMGVRLPPVFKVQDLEFVKMICMNNVDGVVGRNLKLLFGAKAKDDRVEAGCFFGSPEEFVIRAKGEGKLIYADVIPAVFAATRQHLKGV